LAQANLAQKTGGSFGFPLVFMQIIS